MDPNTIILHDMNLTQRPKQDARHEPNLNISRVQHSCNTTINSEFYNTLCIQVLSMLNLGSPYTNKVSHLIRSNIFWWNLTVKNVIANSVYSIWFAALRII